MDRWEKLECLGLMAVTCSEGLIVLACPDCLSLEINDISKGKVFSKMVKRVKSLRQLYWFGACWRRPKIPHRRDAIKGIDKTLPRWILYGPYVVIGILELVGQWNSILDLVLPLSNNCLDVKMTRSGCGNQFPWVGRSIILPLWFL